MSSLLYFALFSSVFSPTLAHPPNILPLQSRASLASRRGFSPSVTSLVSTGFGQFVDVEIDFGGQSFLVEVDLGSSDTWVLGTGYECISPIDNSVLPQSSCGYINSTYDISSTFFNIANQSLGVFYGAGIVAGKVGYETVTIGGITIP